MSEYLMASRRRRVLAFLIDHMTIGGLAVAGFFAIFSGNLERVDATAYQNFKLALPLVFLLYVLKDSIRGISLGRWVLGIAVRDQNESSTDPGILRLAFRNLPLILWPIEICVLAFNPGKRRLGDFMGRTVVVRHQETPAMKRGLWAAAVGVLLLVGFTVVTSLMLKNTTAYKQSVDHIAASAEVKNRVGEITGFGFLPQGQLQWQGDSGDSQFQILVKGDLDTARVHVHLERQGDGHWYLEELQILE